MATMDVTSVQGMRTRLPTMDMWKNLPLWSDGLASRSWCRAVGLQIAISQMCLVRGSSRYSFIYHAQNGINVFLFVKNESIKFCCSGGFSNVPDVVEASVLFISTVFHVRSGSCRCLYLGFRAPCAARVTRVTCSRCSILGVPLETE